MPQFRPFLFDNFVIEDPAAPAVLDLSVNRPRPKQTPSDNTSLLNNIDAKLNLLLNQGHQNILPLVKMILAELSPVLVEKESLAIVAAFIAEKFPDIGREKVLDFYFHPDIIYEIQPVLASLAEKNNFEGKLLLHKDSSLPVCDCRIMWGKNRYEFDSQQRIAAIIKALEVSEKENRHDK